MCDRIGLDTTSATPRMDRGESEFVAGASVAILDQALEAMSLLGVLRERLAGGASAFERQVQLELATCAQSIESICRTACQLRLMAHGRNGAAVRALDPLHSRPTERPPGQSRS